MKIFEDVFTGDEVLSDAIDIKIDESNSIISVVSKMINPDDGGNIDIGCSNHFGGNNDDEEGGDQGGDDGSAKVNNIVHSFNLEQYPCSKDDFKDFLKEKIADVKKRLAGKEDRLKEWGPGGAVSNLMKNVLKKFDDGVEIYLGKSAADYNYSGMMIVSMWANDEDTGPTFYFFKDCLREVKV